MKKKKILIIISSLQLGGGAERVASTIGTELNKKHEVHYLTFYDREKLYPFEGRHSSLNETDSKSLIVKSIKLFNRAKKIASYCKKHKIDTCISFMEAANFPLVLSKTLFRNKSKVIISVHNTTKLSKYETLLAKTLYPRSDLKIVVSNDLKNIIKKRYNLKKLKTIYNPLFIEIKKITRKNNKLFNFINVGRLENQKGQEYLIKSFYNVYKNNKNVKLTILGEGSLRPNLEKLIKKLNLEKNVELKGNVSNVKHYLDKADCFVLSSLHEGMGIVLIEALSRNLLVISTDCRSGPREILAPNEELDKKIFYPYYGEYGILVRTFYKDKDNKKEIDQLSESMNKIIKDKKLKEKYNNIYTRAKDFELKKITKEWEKII